MADTTIKINEEARDRFRAVAEERGLSTRALVEEIAAHLVTQGERAEAVARNVAYVRAHLCPELADADIQQARDLKAALRAGVLGEVR
ncbi:hypothetical protein EDD99_3118 [Streptomyces sp. 846.5]|nr:antitoxin MazE7 [Streptomyces sp. 846.5]TDU04645.1 hypothetical protein EDD99_3118 [Streptomyces sp. 846.5]